MKTALIIIAPENATGLASLLVQVPHAEADEIVIVPRGAAPQVPLLADKVTVLASPGSGFGACASAGAAEAITRKCDLLVFLDSEHSFSPGEIPLLTYRIKNRYYQAVFGSRLLTPAAASAQPLATRIRGKVASFLIRLIWGFRYTDVAPFRAIRADSLQRLRLTGTADDWLLQMQIRSLRLGFKVKEVAVNCHPARTAARAGIARVVSSVLFEFFNGG